MEVILLEKIRNLGGLGDKVSVKPGYGRNYLIPYGKAVPATRVNIADFEARRADLEQRAQELLESARKRAEAVANLSVEIPALTAEEGKLYGSVGTREIADAISAAGVDIKKSEVLLPLGAFRYVGEYEVELQLHSDVTAHVKVNIVAQQ